MKRKIWIETRQEGKAVFHYLHCTEPRPGRFDQWWSKNLEIYLSPPDLKALGLKPPSTGQVREYEVTFRETCDWKRT